MKILFVASVCNLFEVHSGGALRNNMFVEALSHIGHVDIITFHQKKIVSNIQNSDVIYSDIIEDKNYSWDFARSWLSIALMPNNPYSYYKLNKRKAKIVNRYVHDGNYDIIACRYIESAIKCGLLKYKEKLVIDLDDHPVNKLEIIISQIKIPVVRWKKQYEKGRIGCMIEKVLNEVKCSFYSNSLEKPAKNSVYLHNTISISTKNEDVDISQELCILYIGAFVYYPSRYGILHFIDNIFPLIKEKIPDVKLRIVGKGSIELIESFNMQKGIEAVGYVDDIVEEYKKARVVVVPIYQGTGTCIKFIEGLFMNRPVVSTPIGARGFDSICRDGEHYMLANNDEEFANKTIELLSSISKSKEIARNGYSIAQKNYSLERFCKIVKEAIIIHNY